ncbi:unnamed protein product [Acidithrix sp. C25]|nr:unnamed protein product [Acidithrix sp. C25]
MIIARIIAKVKVSHLKQIDTLFSTERFWVVSFFDVASFDVASFEVASFEVAQHSQATS